MPKGSNKTRARRDVSSGQAGEVTVYDFANADPATASRSGRMKKGSAVEQEAKQMTGSTVRDKSGLAWYEKELEDFEPQQEETLDLEEEDEILEEMVPKKSPAKGAKKRKEDDSMGAVMPMDFWFLIANKVDPEDIGRFAGICHATHFITHTFTFWINLYNRYRGGKDLPSGLQPVNMERHHGLRARVIKALFLLYAPLERRLKSRGPFANDELMYKLEGARCSVMWHQKNKNMWHFYFKFKREGRTPCVLTRTDKNRNDVLLGLDNIYENPDEDSLVMCVISLNFISLPIVMGLVLSRASLNVSQNMRYHRLKLMFNSHQLCNARMMASSGVTVILDPVVNIKVLHWWDQQFPTTYSQTGDSGNAVSHFDQI